MFEGIVRRGILTAVATLIICILGIAAAFQIPVQMIPDLDVRTISISTNWSGATPQDVEKDIVIQQEEYLRTIPGLTRIVSTVTSGEAQIELDFPFDIDLNETLISVNNALSQVPSYPLNVDQPRVRASSFSANAFMYFAITPLQGNPRNLDMDMMGDFVEDNVRTRMERVPGVSQVSFGGALRQVQVLIDPQKLAARNITLEDVRGAISTRNRDVSGGELESGKQRFLLRTVGRFEEVTDLNTLILARRGDSVIRLGDVATVQLDHFRKTEIGFVNGAPSLNLSVRRETGSNVIDIKTAMMAEVEAIDREVLRPQGMQINLTSDDVRYVEDSIENVWTNLAIGAGLATLVLYLFLRSGRATLIGVIGIPICTIAAFIGLMLTGRTINVISLAGVAFAVGMTLDNTIVVLESIDLAKRRGLDRMQAAIEGVKEVWPAVLASTMTTVLVFLPILFIQEEAGQLYSDVAIAISASILASMFVAITAVPAAAARMKLGPDKIDPSPDDPVKNPPVMGGRATARAVGWMIASPFRRIAVMLVTVATSAWIIIALTPPAEYLPEGEEAKVFATMNAPPGYNITTMAEIAKEIQDDLVPFLADEPEKYARGEAEFPALMSMNVRAEAQSVRIVAETKDPAHIEPLMELLTQKYQQYPGMRAFASRGSIISSNDGGTRSVNLDISGPNLGDVYKAAQTAYDRAEKAFDNPRIQADPPTLQLAQPMIEIRPKWERAAELGMNAEQLGFAVSALTDGAFVGEFFREDDKIDIYLFSNQGVAPSPDRLAVLPIYTPQGSVVPLSSIADVVETVDTSSIRRVNGRRTVTLNIIAPRDVALETAVARVQQDVVKGMQDDGQVPAGVTFDISGAADQLDATRAALMQNYLVAILIVYLLLVAIFSHWGYPLLIMTAIPIGIAAGIVGLALMNVAGVYMPLIGLPAFSQPFDMISMLGFLILMGTVVNNPILLVERAVSNIKKPGMDATEAVLEAVSSRLRPIAMATITTIFGLAPLVLIPGAGSELYRGLGAIVLFGIFGSMVVTLTFLPALTVTVLNWTYRRKDAEKDAPADEPDLGRGPQPVQASIRRPQAAE